MVEIVCRQIRLHLTEQIFCNQASDIWPQYFILKIFSLNCNLYYCEWGIFNFLRKCYDLEVNIDVSYAFLKIINVM